MPGIYHREIKAQIYKVVKGDIEVVVIRGAETQNEVNVYQRENN